jgi:uncharacterized membrane-anchored protein
MVNSPLKFDTATNIILFGALAVVLLLANYLIISREQVLADGNVMLLELAPRDPRSILQGDYMVLRYRIAADIAGYSSQLTDEGQVVVSVDANNVAHFQRIHDGAAPLNANEHLLLYRKRNGVVKIASDAFYFQERHGNYYTTARYGEVRVSSNGDAVLTGLRDGQLNKLTAVTAQR